MVEQLEERLLLSQDSIFPLPPPEAPPVLTAQSSGMSALVRAFDETQAVPVAGSLETLQPYVSQFGGGVRVASGDINGDGFDDIITGAGPGGGPHVRVFSGADGSVLRNFFAYDAGFTGGVTVASGDIDGDGFDDIITGAGTGGGPHVRVFSGQDGSMLRDFFAYDARFLGGISVASGDVDFDGRDDIITGAGPGGGPHVRAFSGVDNQQIKDFFAYDAQFLGGVSVGSGDVNLDGFADIITGAGPGGGPHVKVFSGRDDALLRSFFAYNPLFFGGVNVAGGDLNGDGFADIVAGAGPGGGPHLRAFNGVTGEELFGFLAEEATFTGGINVAVPRRNPLDGQTLQDDLLFVPGPTGEPVPVTLRIDSGNTSFANELGIYPIDNALGQIGSLLPGDTGYAQAAIQAAVFAEQFASGTVGTQDFFLELLGNQRYGLFLIQNATSAEFLSNNPTNDPRDTPLAFFSFNAASPDGFDHLVFQDDCLIAGWEDLLLGGDRDFDDLVIEFLFDQETPPPAVSLMLDGDFDTEPLGDNSTLFEFITLSGQTDPNLTVTLPILDLMTQADADGNFFFENVPLMIGDNTFTVEADGGFGNIGRTMLTITRECGFFEDLRGHTVTILGGDTDPGSVMVQNTQAVLREGDSFSVALERTFLIPDTAAVLSIEFANLNFDTTDTGFINDAFEFALLDANGQTLVPPFMPGRDAFFNLTEGLPAELATGVSLNGNIVTLDLSGLFAGTPATLVVRLVNNDSDTETTVAIACIQVQETITPATTSTLFVSPPSTTGTSSVASSNNSAVNTTTVPPLGAVTGLPAGTTTVPAATGNGPGNLPSSADAVPPQFAALADTASSFDTRGTEFWIGFMDNLFESGNAPQKALYITGDIATTGFVEIPGLIDPMTSLPFRVDFIINPGEVTTIELPSNDPNDTSFDTGVDFDVEAELIAQVEQRGVHVVTLDPVTVYGINRAVNTTDAFLAIPVDALGTEYINLGYQNGFRLIANTPNTQFLVVATEDNTVVNIVPGAFTFSTPAAFAEIFRPSGTTTSELRDLSSNGNDIGPALLDQSGVHTLTIRPPFEGYSGKYRFELLDFATAATVVNVGDLITANFADGRSAQLFAIDVLKGQTLYYDAINPSPPPNANVEFITPSGLISVLGAQTDNNGLPSQGNNPMQIREDGRHYLLVTGSQDAAFDFSFRFLDTAAAPSLPLDTDITETLDPGEARVFQLQGTSGQTLFLDSFTPSNLSLMQLFGPGGELKVQLSSNADNPSIRITDPGTYFLVIGAGNINAPNEIAFRVLDLANVPALGLGTVINQSFADGKSNLFRVTSTGAQQLNFDVTAGSPRVQIEVFDPAGNRITVNGPSDFSAPLLTAGDYLVVVRGIATGDSGSVTFNATLSDDPVVAKSGFNTTQTLTINPGEIATFQFSGPAGTPFLVDGQDNVDEDLNVDLLDPNGVRIFSGAFPANEQQDIPVINPPAFLPLSGTYTVRISGQTAATSGSYTFRVLDLETFATPLAFDTIQTGTLPTGRDSVVFSFNATAGELYNFNGLSGDNVQIRVRDAQLGSVFSVGVFDASPTTDGPFRIDRTGIHYVILRGNQNTAANFSFQIQDLNTAPIIGLGDVVSGVISPGRSQPHFRINLTAGQKLFLDSLDNDTEPGNLRIRRPGGDNTFVLLAANLNGDSSSQLLLTVPETGEYLLTLEGNADVDTDFSFRILDLDNAPLLAFDTDIDIMLDPGREATFFRIDADVAETLNFDNTTGTGIGTFQWRLFDPLGRDRAGDNNGQDFSGRVLVDGTYYLGILGRSNSPINFSFRATRTADASAALTGFNTEVTLNVPINGQGDYAFEAPAGRLIYVNVKESVFAIPEHTVTLNAGETYLVRDQRGATFGFGPDLTGSIITGDKPIAVFGGSRATFVPTNFFAADHLVEQLPPTNTWGRRFVTFPLATGTTVGDRFRILAQSDDTDIFLNNVLVATLNRGEFHEQIIAGPAEITTNFPVLVAQYAHSQQFYQGQTGGDPAFQGDPFMLLVPPFEQFLSNYTVTTPAEESIPIGERFDRNFINLLAPAEAVGQIELDGVPIDASQFTAIGSSGFFGAQIAVELGSYQLAGPLPFGVFVYGFGSFDSYGYTGGQALSSVANVSAVLLSPEMLASPLNVEQTFTATLTDDEGNPVQGVRVDFAVSGANPQSGFAFSDASGQAVFRYTGLLEGRDVVTASVGPLFDEAIVDWQGAVAPPTITVFSPLDGASLPAGTTLVASGLALAETPLASLDAVLVNGVAVEQFDGAGNFFSRLFIGPGENVFEFVAVDSLNQIAVARLTITGVQAPVGQVDFTQFSDVTGSFQPQYARTSYNSDTSTLFADIAIRNAGQFSADVPLLVAIANISDPRVRVRNPDGFTPDGIPYYDFTGLTNSNSLQPGEETGVLSASFFNPNQAQFTYGLVFFAQLNQAPAIITVPPISANIGRGYVYDVDASDPEHDSLTFSLVLAPDGMTIDSESGLITWTPTATDRGSHVVTVQVSDGRGGTAEQTFSLQASHAPPNRAPVFTSQPIVAAFVDSDYEYDVEAADADGDTLMFQLITAPAGMMIDPATGFITWTPAADQSGDQLVTVEVSDGNGGTARQTFTLCSFDALGNHPPVIFSVPPTFAMPGTFSRQVLAIDPDHDTVQFSLIAAPVGMQIDGMTGMITWDPAVLGNHNITVRATDARGAFSEQSFLLQVIDNHLPTIVSIPNTTAAVGQNYSYDVEASDLDSDMLEFHLLDAPTGMHIDPDNGLISWLPDALAFERERVVVQVSDGNGGLAVQTFDIMVTGGQSLAMNRMPVFTSQPPSSAMVGETLIYRAVANDANDDPLTFDLPLAPVGMAVDADSGVLVWNPTADQVGLQAVVFRVQDGRGGVQVQSFDIEVAAANNAPVITSEPVLEAAVGRPFAYRIFAQDADGDALTFSLQNPPGGATLSPQSDGSAFLLFTPAATGTVTFTVHADDGRGGTAAQSFDLVILTPDTNQDPTIDSAPRLSIALDQTWVYRISASDADADPLTITLNTAPSGMQFDPVTGLATWSPTPNQLGGNAVTFTVDDGQGGLVQQSFQIDVTAVAENMAPQIVSRPPTGAEVGELFTYDLRAFDAENDPVEWRLIAAPEGVSLDASRGTLRWTPTLGQLGLQQIIVEAIDPFAAPSRQSFTVFVTCVNLPPNILSSPPSEAVAEQRFVYPVRAVDPEGGPLMFSLTAFPDGMMIDAQTGIIRWTPTLAQLGQATATVEVTDNAGNVATQTFVLEVGQIVRNLDPVITSRPVFRAVLEQPYLYQVTARDPEGEALSFSLLTAPAGMSIDANGLIQWTPAANQVGPQIVEVAVTDLQGGRGIQRYALLARANQAPQILSEPITTISAGAIYHYDLQASDPDGDALNYSLAQAPAGLVIDQLGRLMWTITTMDTGPQMVEVVVTDIYGASTTQSFTLDVTPDMVAPQVELLLSANPAILGTDVIITVLASDDVGVETITLTQAGQPLRLDANGTASFNSAAAGLFNLVATVTDAAGNTGTAQATLRVFDPNDTQGPIITLASPQPNAILTTFTDLTGTITDDNLDFYRIEFARADLVDINNPLAADPDYVTLAESSTPVNMVDVLATFDPTLLMNDSYVIRVFAQDLSGNLSAKTLPISLDGQLKLGEFQLSFTDLTIPLAGIPITITRTYSTLQANESGDFGFGWSLDIQDAQIRESLPVNPLETQGLFFAATPFRDGTRIFLTNPAGRRIGFTFQAEPQFSLFGGGTFRPRFIPDPGVYDTLDVGTPQLRRINGAYFDAFSGAPFNPNSYRLTTKDGTVYEYGQFSGLQNIIDRNGNRLEFRSDGIFSSTGESIQFLRDVQGRITTIIDPTGNPLTYTYNANGDLIRFTDQVGLQTQYTYLSDPAHFLDTITDPRGNVVLDAEFDANGRLIGSTDALGNAVSQGFDFDNSLFSTTDANGNITQFRYDNLGNIIEQIDALGNRMLFEYADPANPYLETRIVNQNGHETRFTYDTRGNLLTEIDAIGGAINFGYDSSNNLMHATDALGRATRLTYDSENNLVSQIDANGNSEIFSYDNQGRVLTQTDLNGNTTVFTYGTSLAVPTVVSFPDGTTRESVYDNFGNLVRLTDELGFVTIAEFAGPGRQTRILGPSGEEIQFLYDGGLLIEERRRLNATTFVITTFEYDEAGRQIRQTDAEGGVTEIEYDQAGNVVLIRDSVGNETMFRYDALNRLVERTDVFGHSTRFEYDAVGNQTAVIDRTNRRREFVYDQLNRGVSEIWFENNAAIYTASFVYNAVGNLLSATDPNSTLTFTYDNLNRVTSVDNLGTAIQPRFALTYEYDAFGNLTSVRDNAGIVVRSEYDVNNRLSTRAWDGPTIDPARVEFEYNNRGERTEIRRFSDLAGNTQINRSTFAYDASGRTSAIRYFDAIDAAFIDYEYTYDLLERLTSEAHHGNRSDYTYDLTGQLLSAERTLLPDENYAYDANGNRTDSHLHDSEYVTGTSNRLTSDGDFEYEYDDEDRLLRKTNIATGDFTDYQYDHRNRLIRVTERTSGGVIVNEVAYTYDVLNRRIATTVNGLATIYVFKGDDIWADFNAAGEVQAQYLTGSRIDELIARHTPTEGTHWYLTDQLGTVYDLIDSSGNLIGHRDYDSFGNILASTGGLQDDRFGFTGREFDALTGLYYYRARYYDPGIGRFITPDPLGFAAGDTNFFRYVFNRPTSFIDPSGQISVSGSQAAALVLVSVIVTAALVGSGDSQHQNTISISTGRRENNVLIFSETTGETRRGRITFLLTNKVSVKSPILGQRNTDFVKNYVLNSNITRILAIAGSEDIRPNESRRVDFDLVIPGIIEVESYSMITARLDGELFPGVNTLFRESSF